MTHGRKPRRPRAISANPLCTVLRFATKLTPAEKADVMAPTHACRKALSEGVATELQFDVLQSVLQIAITIERSGIVRGLAGHLYPAQQACNAIHARALACGAWHSPTLTFEELDAITNAIELHAHQLDYVSAGELQRIVDQTMARTASAGGTVRKVSNEDLAAMAA